MKNNIFACNSELHLGSALQALLAALLIIPVPLLHAAGPEFPGAGSILQQIKSAQPPIPANKERGLRIEGRHEGTPPASAPFLIKAIRVTGNTLFGRDTLHALVADAEGRSLSLAELGARAANITDFYHRHGYPLARAFIPAQTIRDGSVEIRVLEARYNAIVLDNHSEVNESLLLSTLSPIQRGDAVYQDLLDHQLLLLSDIPGITIDATLKPGETAGTSDLLVAANPTPPVGGIISLDNYGTRESGRVRLSGTAQMLNLLHYGDILSVTGLTAGTNMNYGRLGYEMLLNDRGTRLGASYSALHYRLGNTLSSLDAHGTAQVGSLWLKHPLVRRQSVNVYGQLQYDQLQLRDDIDTSAVATHRHIGSWTLSLNGDWRDSLLYGAVSSWNFGLSSGRVGFDNAGAQLADAATAKAEGNFTKWNLGLSRLQNLSPQNSLYLAFSRQWSNGNLDQAEKVAVGGIYTVRAYDMGITSGDAVTLGTVEFRRNLRANWGGEWQLVAFVDSAHVTLNKEAWAAGTNSLTLSGAGVGLNWAGPNQWSARTYIATPIGSRPNQLASTPSAHAWLEIRKIF